MFFKFYFTISQSPLQWCPHPPPLWRPCLKQCQTPPPRPPPKWKWVWDLHPTLLNLLLMNLLHMSLLLTKQCLKVVFIFPFFVVVIFLLIMIHFIYVNLYIFLEHNFDAHFLHNNYRIPTVKHHVEIHFWFEDFVHYPFW